LAELKKIGVRDIIIDAVERALKENIKIDGGTMKKMI
jgi:hypothetical protein